MSTLTLIELHSLAPGLAEGAAHQLSCKLEGPECLGLTGPSGSGKSLLLRAIADLDPSGGKALLDGVDRNTMPAHVWRSLVGYLPAEGVWWSDRVGDHFRGHDPYAVDLLGFDEDVMTWSVARLSTGEKQRLALSRLLAQSPRALLLDEPTASLDARRTIVVERIIADYAQAQGAPMIWVSHDSEQLKRVCKHALRLHRGGRIEDVTWT